MRKFLRRLFHRHRWEALPQPEWPQARHREAWRQYLSRRACACGAVKEYDGWKWKIVRRSR